MSYYEFASDSGTGYGSLEAFHVSPEIAVCLDNVAAFNGKGEPVEPGWYWWPCFPGCIADGDAVGPFQTEREAVIDAGGIWDDLSETHGAVG